MRKCKFKIYDIQKRVFTEFQNGLFHQFGTELEEDDRGFHENTIAIVETSDGILHKVEINKIEFINE